MNFYNVAGFLSLSFICFTISCTRHVIRITGGDTASQKLVLQNKDGSPADTIKVHEDDKVLWKIKTKAAQAITAVADKGNEKKPSFLTMRTPHKKFLSRTWVEKVNRVSKDSLKGEGYVDEPYFIKWKPKEQADTLTYDPLMQIYPKAP